MRARVKYRKEPPYVNLSYIYDIKASKGMKMEETDLLAYTSNLYFQ
jgi:hypothetical protein